jgi:dTDP-4-amino-4,6-dideoxygalactose transaminase
MIKYSIPWWKTSLGKEEAQRIEKAVLSRCITQGPLTEKLEKKIAELLDVPYVVLTINGSAALLMALAACDIKPQDEVVVPNFTFIATAQAPLFLGAKIKLVDVEQTRPVIDIKEIRKSITKKTKVIIPVHVNGRSADMNLINKIAAEHNLRVIEDSVQSLCSQNEFGYLGTQSDIGVFSLGITKFITAGMGGFLVTRNKKLFNKLRKIRNH